MQEFVPLAQFEVKGRGTVIVVQNPEEFEFGKCPLKGKTVIIEGRRYEVAGVGSWAIQTIRKGSPIDLLVKPVTHPE